MWNEFGRETMLDTHKHLMLSLARPECKTHVSFDRVAVDFPGELERWMDGWGVRAEARPALRAALRRHDMNARSAEERARDHHVSGSSFTTEQKRAIRDAFLAIDDAREILTRQRRELEERGWRGVAKS